MPLSSDAGFFRIGLLARETDDYPALPDINYFLHDFNLLYELSRVIVDPKYRDYRFSRFFGYRNRRRIDAADQLKIEQLRQESPLHVVTIVEAVPAAALTLWVVVQTFEKITNFRLNRDILELTREKLRGELAKSLPSNADASHVAERFRGEIRIREAEYIYDRIENHLRDSPVRVHEIDIRYVSELPPKTSEEK